MVDPQPTDAQLLAYLDEMLPPEQSAEMEELLRASPALCERAAHLARRRDQGGHTVGEIWRRQRLSCPTRSQLGSYLLGTLDAGLTDYVAFHLNRIGCRVCAANLEDLQRSSRADSQSRTRRRRYFESSAGRLVSR